MWFGRERNEIRPPAVAGSFYPGDAETLDQAVADLLKPARSEHKDQARAGRIRAAIVPHAGYVYSGPVAAEAFAALAPLRGRVKRLVVIGPAHYVRIRSIAIPSVTAFRTPLGDVPLDGHAIAGIADLPQIVVDDEPHAPEHALEVELPFLQALLGPVPLVPLVVGSARASHVAEVLERLWDDDTLVIVSTDLSYYHDYETARRLDARTAHAIEACDETAIGIDDACGACPLRGTLTTAKRRKLTVERLDLRNSGDTAGDKARVVGYGAWVVREP